MVALFLLFLVFIIVAVVVPITVGKKADTTKNADEWSEDTTQEAGDRSAELVIARYNEDISWVANVAKNFQKITVYNKGKPLNIDNFRAEVIQLPNVGREGETYANHLVRNYDNLSDVIVFVQGHPFDHSPDFIKSIKAYAKEDWSFGGGYVGLSKQDLKTSIHGCPHHAGLPIREVYKKIFGDEKSDMETWHFAPGAIFMVDKEAVRKRGQDFYARVKSILDYSRNPIEGYVVERLWQLIFSN